MKVHLNVSHINRLFELTETHMNWFSEYYPNAVPKFSELLRRNHRIIIHYCILDLFNKYNDINIHNKLDRMFIAAEKLQEITLINKGILLMNSKEIY